MFQVKYVLAAARLLNFTKAAALCNVSQPALTKAVKTLEVELGAQVFLRDGKKILLSDSVIIRRHGGANCDRRRDRFLSAMAFVLQRE